jgi:electron transport complex protein RnfC
MLLPTFKIGGVHPPTCKFTANKPIERMPLPMVSTVLMGQHIGKPAVAVVAKGDVVKRGDLIGKPDGFVSAAVHAPISGTVTAVDFTENVSGYRVASVTITASQEDHEADEQSLAQKTGGNVDEALSSTPEQLRKVVAESGIVGLGGATFPAHVKLSVPEGSKSEFLIINAAECEPYLTCDDALMREHAREIIGGIRLLKHACQAPVAIIGIENNKPEAIAALEAAAQAYDDIKVQPVKTKYPQGGEKQLIQALTGRFVGSGALPISVGAVVHNVATAYSVYQAVVEHQPLIERVVTVTGEGVGRPGNYLVTLGTQISDLLAFAEAEVSVGSKILSGGPMMGRAIVTVNAPTTKGTSGLVIMTGERAVRKAESACIRCASCVSACPMGLEPYLISKLSRLHMTEDAASEDIMDCIECGCCSYTCPASIPLLDYIRQGKQLVRASKH